MKSRVLHREDTPSATCVPLSSAHVLRHAVHMREDRGRLGKYVRNARIRAGYPTLSAWARHLGISDRTLGDLERGRAGGPNTIAAVENALPWAPGSAQAILEGGEPVLIDDPPADDADEEMSIEELRDTVAQLTEQLVKLSDQLAKLDTQRGRSTPPSSNRAAN